MRNYLQHGSRHLPTGSDPIPGLNDIAACAVLFGNQVIVDGAPSGTIPANDSGVCIFSAFQVLGDTDTFATHDSGNYPGFPSGPVPAVSGFNNASGDTWLFAVKAGLLTYSFDISFNEPNTFPFKVARNTGTAGNDGGEPLGPQGWYDLGTTLGNVFSWMSLRPIANDSFYSPFPGFYMSMEFIVYNLDSVAHTIDSANGFVICVYWTQMTPGIQFNYY